MSQNTKYNETVCPLMESRGGNLSWRVTPEVYDQFKKLAPGGRLLVRFLKPEQRKNGNRSPKAYLEYMTAEEVAKFDAERNITQSDAL